MSNFHELNCLVPPMYCGFKTVTVSWWALAWQELTLIFNMCNYLLSSNRPCSSMYWTNTVGHAACSKEGMWWLWKEVKRKHTCTVAGQWQWQYLCFKQWEGLQPCALPRGQQHNEIISSPSQIVRTVIPITTKLFYPARQGQTVSFLSLAMASDPSWPSKGFPTRKPMQ